MVIFGSAVFSPAPARDIDVLCQQPLTEDEIVLIKRHAEKLGVPEGAAIEQHLLDYLPVPCNGDVQIEHVPGTGGGITRVKRFYNLSSFIRRYGGCPKYCAEKLRKWGARKGGGFDFALLPFDDGSFDDYVEGPEAFVSAMRHTNAEEMERELGSLWLFLKKISEEGVPNLGPFLQKIINYNSSSGGLELRIIYRKNTGWIITTRYGSWPVEKRANLPHDLWLTPEEFMKVLWP